MRTIIYADVLAAINFVIDYLLLCATAHLCGITLHRLRICAGAGIGAVSALILLAPQLPAVCSVLLKIGCCVCCTAAAFAGCGKMALLRVSVWYGLLNLLLAGTVVLLLEHTSVQGVLQNNLTVYFAVSPFLLIGCVLAVYLLLEGTALLFGRPSEHQQVYAEVYFTPAEHLTVEAWYDTGFLLQDVFTGEGVLLFSLPAVRGRLPERVRREVETYFTRGDLTGGVHLIPSETAVQQTVLPVVFCHSVTLRMAGHTLRRAQTSVAFTAQPLADGTCPALVGPALAGQLL